MHTQIGRTMSQREWAQETRKPVPVETAPKEKRKGTGRREKSFYFSVNGAWRSESGMTRSEARARLKVRLGVELAPGASLKSRAQRAVTREDRKASQAGGAKKQAAAQRATAT